MSIEAFKHARSKLSTGRGAAFFAAEHSTAEINWAILQRFFPDSDSGAQILDGAAFGSYFDCSKGPLQKKPPVTDLDQTTLYQADTSGVVLVTTQTAFVNMLVDAGYADIRHCVVLFRQGEAYRCLPSDTSQILNSALGLGSGTIQRKLLNRIIVRFSQWRIGPGKRILIGIKSPPPVERWVCDVIDVPAVRMAISIGTTGAFQKVTCQFISIEDGGTLAYSKFACTALARGMVENELQTLRRIGAQASLERHLPKVLGYRHDEESMEILLSPGPASLGPGKFKEHHLVLLQKIAVANETDATSFIESRFCRCIKNRLNTLVDSELVEDIRELSLLLAQLEKVLRGQSIRFTLAHRDFVPWNTRQNLDGSVFVFDWEFAEFEWIPLTDMFHFYVMPELLKGSSAFLLKQYFNEWRHNAQTLMVDETLVLPYYGAYLLDVATFYMVARALSPDRSSDLVTRSLMPEIARVLEELRGWT